MDAPTPERIEMDETRAKLIFSDDRVEDLYHASRGFHQYASMDPTQVREGYAQECFKELKRAREAVGPYLNEAQDGQQRLEREYIVMLAYMTGLDEVVGKVAKTPVDFQLEHIAECLDQFPKE